MIKAEINGRPVEMPEGTTILDAATELGIKIPTLCHSKVLSPYGACRVCLVEVKSGNRTELKTSCNNILQEGMVITTDTERVMRSRRTIVELVLARNEEAEPILELARELGIKSSRFPKKDDLCILCGLCVRMCEERMGKAAISFSGRGTERKVVPPFDINTDVCQTCGACASICPANCMDFEKDVTVNEPRPLLSKYDADLRKRSPIDIEFPQAVPNWAYIDRENCVHLQNGDCRICQDICEADAIDYEQEDEKLDLNVGAIVLAPGFKLYDARQKGEYGYNRFPNVITALEYERILSASGPFKGHIQRISDGAEPKRVAFIQCVGSRDQEHPYCSSVCCTFAVKQAILTKEHIKDAKCSIFVMDVRTFGKGFDAYYERAKDDYGVKFIYTRPSNIRQDFKNNNLLMQYTVDGKEWNDDEFDLVVLSVGLCQDEQFKRLAETCSIKLNGDSFADTNRFTPTFSGTEGIYLAGTVGGPKDIPETVTQASAAASSVMELLSDVRGTEVTQKEYPEERNVQGEEPRVGVFVCHCGSNIGGVIDCKKVAEYATGLKNVEVAADLLYTCSPDGLKNIKDNIEKHKLNRVVVASCTPRTHEPLFQETLREAGLNPYLFEMANIRDQCTWVHADMGDMTEEKAMDLVRMSVGRARTIEDLYSRTYEPLREAIVVGGGIAGMTSALDMANQGFPVLLVEKTGELGGTVTHVKSTIDGLKPGELVGGLVSRINAHEKITVMTNSEVTDCKGFIGKFKSHIKASDGKITEYEHGAAVIAIGAEEMKPTEYLYGYNERVKTQHELEALLEDNEGIARDLNEVVMVQCVGSREKDRMVCSRVCCTEAIKNSIRLKTLNPDMSISILYRDIRTYSFFEKYYTQAREMGIRFFRYDIDSKPTVTQDEKGNVTVAVRDLNSNLEIEFNPGLLVLSAGMQMPDGCADVGTAFKVPINLEGFFQEAHMKLRPVDFASDGFFLCGTCHGPKNIEETISQAHGAAARAVRILAQPEMKISCVVSQVDPDKCAACLTCVRTCPYDVPIINKDGVAEIEPAMCHGCGVCAAECPAKAITLLHYKDEQIISKTKALYNEKEELITK